MNKLLVVILWLALVAPAWAGNVNPSGPPGGGGGTTITSCTGDLGSCTQTGAVLAAQVVSGGNIASGTIPNAALVTAALTAASTLDATKLSGAIPAAVTGSPAIALTNVTGTLPTASTAALTGDTTKSAGSNATTAVGGTHFVGGITQTGGSVKSVAIGTPSAPAIVSGFTGGTTDYYFCMAVDANGQFSIASTGTGTTGTTGTMSCGGQTGAVGYDLLRKTASAVPFGSVTVLVSAASPSCTTTSGVSCNIADAGNSLATIIVPKNSDGTGQVIAGVGTLGYINLGTGADQGSLSAGTINWSSGAATISTANGAIGITAGGGASITLTSGTSVLAAAPQMGPTINGVLRNIPDTVGALPACAAGTEGATGTQTDAAVACVAGVTAAAGGSTHCQIYCNGTNWVRTGL